MNPRMISRSTGTEYMRIRKNRVDSVVPPLGEYMKQRAIAQRTERKRKDEEWSVEWDKNKTLIDLL